MWVATEKLPRSPGHPFYERLNQVLVKAGFDPRLFMGHVDKGFQPGVFVRSESGFS